MASGKGIIAQRTLQGVANMLLARFIVWITSENRKEDGKEDRIGGKQEGLQEG